MFPSAGNAQEKSQVENPIGMYRNPDGLEIGVIDPIQGDAVVRQGFVLVEEGRDAALAAGVEKAEESPAKKEIK